jgi:uncharacterized protein YutD
MYNIGSIKIIEEMRMLISRVAEYIVRYCKYFCLNEGGATQA